MDMFISQLGDLLRNVSKEDTELGRKISNMLKNGELVTDELSLNYLKID